MNVFEFADFLKACQVLDIKVDADKLVSAPNETEHEKLIEIVSSVMKLQKK